MAALFRKRTRQRCFTASSDRVTHHAKYQEVMTFKKRQKSKRVSQTGYKLVCLHAAFYSTLKICIRFKQAQSGRHLMLFKTAGLISDQRMMFFSNVNAGYSGF